MSGKGSAPRKGQNQQKYADNFAKIDWKKRKKTEKQS